MILADYMAELRVCSEGRNLVQDRLPHHSAHRFAQLVIPQFEVLPDFEIRDLLEARGSESGMRKETREFKQREPVRRECIERVS